MDDSLGNLSKLNDIVRVHDVQEIIFSAQDVPFSAFSGSMSSLGPGYRYMLAASTTMNIVGSMSRDTEGESYGLRINFNLSHPSSRRSKRLFDVISSFLFILLTPIWILIIPNKKRALVEAVQVLWGKKTWVSYNPADPMITSLPRIAKVCCTLLMRMDIPMNSSARTHSLCLCERLSLDFRFFYFNNTVETDWTIDLK
jgi:hypothetical protein